MINILLLQNSVSLQQNFLIKNDISNVVKKASFDEKLKTVTSNKNESNERSKKVQQKD